MNSPIRELNEVEKEKLLEWGKKLVNRKVGKIEISALDGKIVDVKWILSEDHIELKKMYV